MRRDPTERLIAGLLHLGHCRLPSRHRGDQVDVDSSQDELAQIANLGRTAANAILRELETEGHIELAYRRIRILSVGALRARLQPPERQHRILPMAAQRMSL